MIKFHVRIHDIDEVVINDLRSDEDADFDFDEVFQTNYMMNKNGKDVDILDFRCDEFRVEGNDIYFAVVFPERGAIEEIFISKCDYSLMEIW